MIPKRYFDFTEFERLFLIADKIFYPTSTRARKIYQRLMEFDMYRQMNNFEKIMFAEHLEMADIFRRNPLFLNNIAAYYVRFKQWEDVIRVLKKSIALKDDDIRVLHTIGVAYAETGKPDEGLKYFLECVRQDPDDEDHHFALGHTYALMEDIENAMKAFQHALDINPSFVGALNRLACLHCEKDEHKTAIELYRKIIMIEPDNPDSYWFIANVYYDIDNFELSAKYYRRAVDMDPDYKEAYYSLGLSYHELGRIHEEETSLSKQYWELAIDYYQKTLKAGNVLDNSPPEVYNNLGIVYENLGRWGLAIEAYRKAVSLKPEQEDYRYELGSAYASMGKKDLAIREYEALKGINEITARKLMNEIQEKCPDY